jgi:hypothetical protein
VYRRYYKQYQSLSTSTSSYSRYSRYFSSSNSNGNSNSYRKVDVGGIIFFGSICLGAAGLGVWQTQRYAWKTSLIEEQKRRSLLLLI